MSDLNVAVWGLGPHAVKNVVPACAATQGVRLYGVCTRDAGVGAEIATRYGCRRYASSAAMLDDREVHAVYVATPTGLHEEHGRAVLSAGKHLWCEKPLATSRAGARAILDLGEARDSCVAEALMYLYHPQFAALRDAVRHGRIGELRSIHSRFGLPPMERPGFRSVPELGGGALLDLAVYPVSLVCALLPCSELEVEHAEVRTAAGSAVDTEGRALIRSAAGVSASIEWRTGVAYRNDVDLWGTNGAVSTERIYSKQPDHVPALRFRDLNGNESIETGTAANHFIAMLAAFRDMARDGRLAAAERLAIDHRAGLLSRIRHFKEL